MVIFALNCAVNVHVVESVTFKSNLLNGKTYVTYTIRIVSLVFVWFSRSSSSLLLCSVNQTHLLFTSVALNLGLTAAAAPSLSVPSFHWKKKRFTDAYGVLFSFQLMRGHINCFEFLSRFFPRVIRGTRLDRFRRDDRGIVETSREESRWRGRYDLDVVWVSVSAMISRWFRFIGVLAYGFVLGYVLF